MFKTIPLKKSGQAGELYYCACLSKIPDRRQRNTLNQQNQSQSFKGHNLVHLAVGIFGLSASTTVGGARLFNRFFAISYLLIAVMGLVPVAHTVFGRMPIFGNNIWFNALTALIAGYFGFLVPKKETSISV